LFDENIFATLFLEESRPKRMLPKFCQKQPLQSVSRNYARCLRILASVRVSGHERASWQTSAAVISSEITRHKVTVVVLLPLLITQRF